MCFKIPANAENNAAEAYASSEKMKAPAQPAFAGNGAARAAASASGLIAMLRKLFASFNGAAARPDRHEGLEGRKNIDRREAERVE